jgi:hypothetical protein
MEEGLVGFCGYGVCWGWPNGGVLLEGVGREM